MGLAPIGVVERWNWPELATVALREAQRVLASRHDAEDAAQEAIVRAYRARTRCANPEEPHAWVRTIARREAYRIHARRADRNETEHADDGFAGDATDRVIDRLVAQDALAETSFDDRALLVRRYVLDQTSSQIAAELAMPAATVRVRLHRASKLIRERAAADVA